MPNTRHAELQAGVHRREVKLEIAIFVGVRRQLVSADVDLAPLEALANVPHGLQARSPGREVVVLTLLLTEPLAADPLQTRLRRIVAVDTGEIELSELA